MWKVTLLLAVVAATQEVIIAAPLPCDSYYRIFYPQLFTHCSSCFYGSWSAWTRTSEVSATSHCASGYHYKEKRTRTDNHGKCEKETEERYICDPTLKQKAKILIAELDLHKSSSSGNRDPTTQFRSSPFCPKPIGEKICNSKKRDVSTAEKELNEEELMANEISEKETISTLTDDIIPEPFDIEEHLSIVKANRQKRLTTNQERYVLFIIDASGSIGSNRYRDTVNVIGDLSPLFCGAKRAVMTYSTDVYREICFNCRQDNPLLMRNAIRSLTYHGGLTASGDAVRCACDYMFNSPCGFPRNSRNPPLVDVLFLTDGHSNIGEDVCGATKCLNSINNINVFPIAIGNNNDFDELHCIRGSNGGSNGILMTLTDFGALKTLRDDILSVVNASPPCL